MFLFIATSVTVLGQDLDRLFSLRGDWKFSIGDDMEWANPSFDDSEWEEIYVPRRWEREGFNGYDGYAWYRISVDGRRFAEKGTHYLRLGYIDDVDEVFFNGEKIGFSGSFPPNYYTAWNAKRQYRIPDELIRRDGDNVIAVRILDKGGEGGIYSGDVGVLIAEEIVEDVHNLEGVWKIKVDDDLLYAQPSFDHGDWQDIVVPSNWKTIGLFDIRTFAWYRKEFVIRPDTDLSKMTLIGGRIDDFDQIFINGRKIGETNDGRPFGGSQSYSKLRIYDIPAGILKEGKNVVAVRVEDIGDNGGIYEGPVVIIPTKSVSKYTRSRRSFWWNRD